VLPAGRRTDGHQHFAVAKAFHVSPFLPRDLEYRMSFSQPGERLGVHMADWQGEHKVFDATLNLQRQPLSRPALHRHLLTLSLDDRQDLPGYLLASLRLLPNARRFFLIRQPKAAYRNRHRSTQGSTAMKSSSVSQSRIQHQRLTGSLLRRGVLRQLAHLRHTGSWWCRRR
jgi:DUF1365 family protein